MRNISKLNPYFITPLSIISLPNIFSSIILRVKTPLLNISLFLFVGCAFLSSCSGEQASQQTEITSPDNNSNAVNQNALTAHQRLASNQPPKTQQDQHATIIYLVRHSEKQSDGTADPALTREGAARSKALADLLRGVNFTQIHSTDYIRTRDTAAPILANSPIKAPALYDGRNLDAVAKKIIAQGGTHLVVGHSNTTNELAQILSGKSGSPLTEQDYNRLYIVTRYPDEETNLAIVQFDAFDF